MPSKAQRINYGQKHLLDQLQSYVDIKKIKLKKTLDAQPLAATLQGQEQATKTRQIILDNCVLPFNSLNGLCSGIVAYGLYCKRNSNEQYYLDLVEYLSTWDPRSFKNSTDEDDDKIEEFLNNVAFLQHDSQLRNDVMQKDMHKSIELIRGDNHPMVHEPEFSFTFVFTHSSLKKLIEAVGLQNKMMRFDNGFHTVGAMYNNNKYYFLNPDAEEKPQEYLDSDILVSKIMSGLASHCKSKDYIALNLTVYDINTKDAEVSIDVLDYYRQLLSNQQYKTEVLQHPNIFRLGIRFQDYAMLELLFEHGYVYIKSNLFITTEYGDAIISNSLAKMQYLLDHDIPLDYRTASGITPLGVAIVTPNIPMMYKLLLAGADPNIPANDYWPLINVAVESNNTEAIILLLAFGLNITLAQLEAIENSKYTHEQYVKIVEQAIAVNEIILHIAPRSFKKNATDHHLLLWLMHEQLKVNLVNSLSKAEGKELNALLKSVVGAVTKKPFDEHTLDDLLQINDILNMLDSMLQSLDVKQSAASKMLIRLGLSSADVKQQVTKTKVTLQKYLTKNNVDCLSTHIEKLRIHQLFRSRPLTFASSTTQQSEEPPFTLVAPLLTL